MALTKATYRMTQGSEGNVFDFMTQAQIDDVVSRTGSIDVSAAIQAAIDSRTRGRVFFPEGVYRVENQITWSNIDLIGCGGNYGTQIDCQTSGTAFKLTSTTDRCRVDGILFSGTGTNKCFSNDLATRLGTEPGWRSTKITNCHFSSFDVAIEVQNSISFYVENTEFVSSQGVIFSGDFNNNANFLNCFFAGGSPKPTYGLHFNMDSLSKGNTVTITGCAFDDYANACSIRYGKATITNCYFEDHSSKYIQGDNAFIVVSGGHMQGQTGAGTANAYNLESTTLRELIQPRFVDNFQYIYSIQSNSAVYTILAFVGGDIQQITGGKFYQDVFSEDGTENEFEEGSFTPDFSDGADNAYTGTYSSTPTGYYMRTGDTVFISLTIAANQSLASNGLTGAEDLIIDDLPFVSSSTSMSGLSIAATSAINLSSGYTQILAKIPPNKNHVELSEVGDTNASQNLTVTGCDSTGATFRISGTYQV